MNNQEYQVIRSKALKLADQKKGFLSYLREVFKCEKAQAKLIYSKMVDNEPVLHSTTNDSDIIKADGYVYNQLSDKYIVPLKSYGGDYVCTGDQHRAMLAAYSNWQGGEKSISEIARLYKMRREWVLDYFKTMKWTHDTVPITTEEIIQDKGREAIGRVLDTRRTELQQELQHEDWKRTQKDAESWRLFEAGKVDPFMRALEHYKPKALPKIKYAGGKSVSDEVLLIGLSDIHFGDLANEDELFSGEKYDKEVVKKIMIDYINKVRIEAFNRRKSFKEVAVCSIGDIIHSLTGYTVKGTPLESDVLREEQFELALDSLTIFFTELLKIFPIVTVYAVKGNHAGSVDWLLFKTISIHFRNNGNIKFNLYKSRQACFKIGNTAILMDHGASDFAKSSIPASGTGKEAYIQGLFMQYPSVLVGAKSKLMLQGDKHRFLFDECRGFEHVIMGSCVLGNRYADNLGLYSRARQNCLILNNDGIKEVLSFYFD